ncbi:MAG: DUF4332 domain-containing protein [Leptolyngbyaceae bacterium]|nr:DUF4332 domain-containing protein [Leptolyngbyaceae bacterium]
MASRSRPPSASKSWPIADLPGLSREYQTGLEKLGILTTEHLLQQAKTPAQKEAIAIQLRTSVNHVTKWVALADLARIPSVGCVHCGLLLHAGIASPQQLVQTPLPRLHHQLLKLHVAMMQSKDQCPSLDEVVHWQAQARQITGHR